MSVLYYDGFETTTVGTAPPGWVALNGGNWVVTAINPIHQTQSFAQASATDTEGMLYEGIAVQSNMDAKLCFRASGSGVSMSTVGLVLMASSGTVGYVLYMNTSFGVLALKNLAGTGLTNTAGTFNMQLGRAPQNGDLIWIRGRVIVGSNSNYNVYGKIWFDGQAEPGYWNFYDTDTSITTSGYAGFMCVNTVAGNNGIIDDFSVSTADFMYQQPLAVVTSTGSTTVSLTASPASGGVSPYTYQWYRGTYSNFPWGRWPTDGIVSGATSLTLNDTGLTADSRYYYICVATDSAGVVTPSDPMPANTGTPAGTLTRVTSGLLLQDGFANLSNWSSPDIADWSSSSAFPSFTCYAAGALIQPAYDGHGDSGVQREPHWVWDSTDNTMKAWYVSFIYFINNTANPTFTLWQPFFSKSFDFGLSWQKQGYVTNWKASDGPAGTVALDNSGGSYLNPADNFYYYNVVSSGAVGGTPPNITFSPYGNIVYRSTSLNGPWTFYAITPTTSGAIIESISTDSSFLYGWSSITIQGQLFTSPLGAGVSYTIDINPLFPTGFTSGTGYGGFNNPKYIDSPTIGSVCILANSSDEWHSITTAASVADFGSTSTAFKNAIQFGQATSSTIPLAGASTQTPNLQGVGSPTVITPIYDHFGNVLQDSNGYISVMWGGDGSTYLPVPADQRQLQRIFGGTLEPSADVLRFNYNGTTPGFLYSNLANGNAMHEFVIEPEALSSGASNFYYFYRGTNAVGNTGYSNGYLLFIDFVAHTGHLYVVTAGVLTDRINLSGLNIATFPSPVTTFITYQVRIKILAVGNNHQVYINNTLMGQATDSTYSSGSVVGFYSTAGTWHVRNYHVRSSDTVTVSGLPANAQIVLRAPGGNGGGSSGCPGVPMAQATANGSGTATIAAWHYPAATLDVNGANVVPSNLIFGGDSLTFASSNPPTAGTASTVSTGNTIATVTVTNASGGTPPYTYQWYRSTTSGFTPGAGNIVTGATSQTLNDTGLTNGVTYYYVNVVTDSASLTANSNQTSATPSSGPAPGSGKGLCLGGSMGIAINNIGGIGIGPSGIGGF